MDSSERHDAEAHADRRWPPLQGADRGRKPASGLVAILSAFEATYAGRLSAILEWPRHDVDMRGIVLFVAAISLATSLDASLYNGRYTQAAAQITSHIATHFR
jgi:hypothetical protein